MTYMSMEEIESVIAAFEACTIDRGAWGHPEHLILAYHYSVKNEFDTAYDRMKTGICKLLDAFEVDLSKEMPYHETMTLFWLKTVYAYAKENPEINPGTVHTLIERFDKHYPGRFYSHELLMSEQARTEWVEPDLRRMED